MWQLTITNVRRTDSEGYRFITKNKFEIASSSRAATLDVQCDIPVAIKSLFILVLGFWIWNLHVVQYLQASFSLFLVQFSNDRRNTTQNTEFRYVLKERNVSDVSYIKSRYSSIKWVLRHTLRLYRFEKPLHGSEIVRPSGQIIVRFCAELQR